MKQVEKLEQGWSLMQLRTHGRLPESVVRDLTGAGPDDAWLALAGVRQVHEALLEAGRIEDPAALGGAAKCTWVSDADWVYRLPFPAATRPGRAFLHFRGLDTLVDVYLNGQHLAFHNDIYLPLRIDVTDALQPENVLLLHFYSPQAYLETIEMPAEYEGLVRKNRLLRKPHEDFNDFNGAKPYFTTIGPYGDVLLERVDAAEIVALDIDTALAAGYGSATVLVRADIASIALGMEDLALTAELRDPAGGTVAEAEAPVESGGAGEPATARLAMEIDAPQLWWPRGYGQQPLYELAITLKALGETVDQTTRRIGFRDVRMDERLDCRVNGLAVKLWGANLTPLDGVTHRWNHRRMMDVLDLVENAHMTSLRIWGPGAPYHESLYDECDRRGILVWDEFYHTWGMYPEHAEYRELCRREAEHHVRARKHHPSIVLWCGGNEQAMGAGIDHPGKPVLGAVLYEKDYAEVCARLDPTRYYHLNSPIGGAFPNDPRVGDSHSYTHMWFVPGELYPVLFTENTRISTAPLRTLERVLGEKLWPSEGFDGHLRSRGDSPIPPAWQELTLGHDFVAPRVGPIETFYDTGDSPEGCVYRLGAAHSLYVRRYVERYRRGRPAHDPDGPRRTMGHYLWKLNNTWPMIYSNVIDYFLEPNMAYYALRRAYEPVLLSFDFDDHIHLWLVNDTAEAVEGTVSVRLVDVFSGKVMQELFQRAAAAPGQSLIVANLDAFGMFHRKLAIVAALTDAAGRTLAESIDFADIERHLDFPKPTLELAADGDGITVSTDGFARCVELRGSADGDEFGWAFEDNYFDLAPGRTRRVGLRGRHRSGTIEARVWQFGPIARLEL